MAAPVSETLWTLEEVDFAFDGCEVLNRLNLSIETGHSYGILGPNGSGKTTLLDLLCGLLKPDRGRITYRNKNLSSWKSGKLATRIALVPQEFAIYFDFTVREVVAMGRHPHVHRFSVLSPKEHTLIDAVMRDLGILHLAGRPVTQLSGGEKQRTAVARALVQEPEVLLLDEATSNLDIFHTLEILQVLKQRIDAGLTVVSAIHDLNFAAAFCDRVLFLRKGRVMYQGSTEELLQGDIIHEIYGVNACVQDDAFSGNKLVSYRLDQ